MVLECFPDITQAVMENVLSEIVDADTYINDVGAFSDNLNCHVNLLATILRQLHENGFTINPLRSEWSIKETDWLGYWLTPGGSKPWKKKIMDHPCTATELCMFSGCVNYLRESLVLINCELRNINSASLKPPACMHYSHTPLETKKN
jgi:hypothetical protein